MTAEGAKNLRQPCQIRTGALAVLPARGQSDGMTRRQSHASCQLSCSGLDAPLPPVFFKLYSEVESVTRNSRGTMDSGGRMDPESNLDALDAAAQVFAEQLIACLDECARGRKGLFSDYENESGDGEAAWPEAAQLRQLALALQGAQAQTGSQNALAGEFLDLCSIHGESHPGERKLARAFLERIERGEVGTGGEGERKPW
jgi:hypothetical protein